MKTKNGRTRAYSKFRYEDIPLLRRKKKKEPKPVLEHRIGGGYSYSPSIRSNLERLRRRWKTINPLKRK